MIALGMARVDFDKGPTRRTGAAPKKGTHLLTNGSLTHWPLSDWRLRPRTLSSTPRAKMLRAC